MGENIISNPSFDNGLTDWTGGDGKALSTSYFTVYTTGGSDGGAYIVGTSNGGNTAAGSIATGWSLQPGTDYYFRIDIKQMGTGNSTVYLVTTLTTGMTTSDNTAGRLYGSGTSSYTPTFGDYALTSGSWCTNEAVFNSGSYTYCQCRFRWLSSQFGFDNFYLCPVTEASDNDAIALLQSKLATLQDSVLSIEGSTLQNLGGLKAQLDNSLQRSKSYNASQEEDSLNSAITQLRAAIDRAAAGVALYNELGSRLVTMQQILTSTDYEGKGDFTAVWNSAHNTYLDTDRAVNEDFKSSLALLNDGFYSYFGSYTIPPAKDMADGGEYYLYNTYYKRLIGSDAAGTAPALSYLGVNSDTASYVWVAQASTTSSYYYLQQKSSSKYMVCSTANSWSMTFATAKGSANTYLWAVTKGTAGTIQSLYSGKYLGCDSGAEASSYVGFYYDKAIGSLSTWQLLDASYGSVEAARLALAKSELGEAITAGKDIVKNSSLYQESLVSNVETILKEAMVLYATTTTTDKIDEITTQAATLQSAISACFSGSATTWASGDDFAIGSSYTVALGGLKLKEGEGLAANILIQNSNGNGFMLTLGQNDICVGGATLLQDCDNTSARHDYLFSCNGGKVTLYRDSIAIAQFDTYPMKAASGAAYAVMGEGRLTAYMPEIVSLTQALKPSDQPLNSHGKWERTLLKMVGQQLTLDTPVDLHIIAATGTAPINSSTVNFASEDAWVIFDNELPSNVISSYLNSFKVKGFAASNGSNVRIAIYLNGAAVIPHPSNYPAFYGYDESNCTGNVTSYSPGTHKSLGKAANTFKSFVLKRGYMATLASTPDGGADDGATARSYSRVYVADHADVVVNDIPEALNRRISFVSVRRWQYNSKKGWGTTGSSATACNQVRSGWCYSWSAGYTSGADYEFVPMKSHLYWPGWDEVNGKTASNHLLLYNEPEHSEQHSSDKCSCGGVISAWSAFTNSVPSLASGMRVGAPSPTDASYLTTFTGYCDAYHHRCDFVGYHYYGTDLSSLKSTLASIHSKTGRPIWITETEYGDSWGDTPGYTDYATAAAKVKAMMDLFESLDYVERYVIYNWDLWYNMLINYSNWVTPAGQVYRDYKSGFAYNADQQFVSPWWRPSAQEVTLTGSVNTTAATLDFTAGNPNGDTTDKMVIEHKDNSGTWENFYSENDRSLYDNDNNKYSLDALSLTPGDHTFRLSVTTLYGSTKTSSEFTLTVPAGLGVKSLAAEGLSITTGKGVLTLTSSKSQEVTVYTPEGKTAAKVELKAGESINLALPAGNYLVGGSKIVINH